MREVLANSEMKVLVMPKTPAKATREVLEMKALGTTAANLVLLLAPAPEPQEAAGIEPGGRRSADPTCCHEFLN